MTKAARDIANRLRLRPVGQGQWRGDCPACGYTESLVLSSSETGRALWWCASCRNGRAIATALRDRGVDMGQRDSWDTTPAKPRPSSALNTTRALALWNAGSPSAGSPVETYLGARGLTLPAAAPLRFLAACPHPTGGKLPAMLALVTTPAGTPIAVHRTFLRSDGRAKAEADPARATLGPVHGHAVVLHPLGAEIVVGEGIESSLSAAAIFGLPAVAALTAGSLATGSWLPPRVERVLLAADNDQSGTGQRAAEIAAGVLLSRGVQVRVALPDATSLDFNDLLIASLAKEANHA
jgi:hypothetical protein